MDITLRKIENILSQNDPYDEQNARYEEYFWCRRKAEYVIRLMFAVTVDLVIRKYPTRTKKILYEVRRGTLGSYVTAVKKCLMSSLPSDIQDQFRIVWNELEELKENRNDDAHRGTPENELMPFISNTQDILQKIINITERKYFDLSKKSEIRYSYLTVPENAAKWSEKEDIDCKCILQDGEALYIKIRRRDLLRGNDNPAGQLYLFVESEEDTQYYRLSPFIELDPGSREPVPTMFMGAVQFWIDEVSVEHIRILDTNDKRDLPFIECTAQTLIPDTINKNAKFYSISTQKGKYIDINISQYPGYSDIVNSTYKYCVEICPAVNLAVQFCKERSDNYQIVCGSGGLGKTALVFHLIHDVIIKGNTDFSKVIFLSAKKYFRYTNINNDQQDKVITPDIDSYEDFIDRLAYYLLDEKIASINDNDLLEFINNGSSKIIEQASIPYTFLVVDDLDTFSLDNQYKVVEFLKKINRKKMNALITTRNSKTNGYQIQLNRLNAEESMNFLKWCIEQEQCRGSKRICEKQDADVLYHYTEGRPLDIKLWSNLLIRGLNVPVKFERYWTKKQRTIYLYQTALSQMTTEEQQLYQLTCGIHSCFLFKNQNSSEINIPFRLIEYLHPEKGRDEIITALRNLEDLNLLFLKGEIIIVEDIDYFELIRKAGLPPLPEEKLSVLNDIRSAAEVWMSSYYVERLIKYLASRLGNQNSEYERSVLNRIAEDEENLRKAEYELILSLFQQFNLENLSVYNRSGVYEEDSFFRESDIEKIVLKLGRAVETVSSKINSGFFDENEVCLEVRNIAAQISTIMKLELQPEVQNRFLNVKKQFIDNDLNHFY